MTEPTEYEMLLKDQECLLNEIEQEKRKLASLQYYLKKARAALVKYKTLSVAHISDTLEKPKN
jgi:hypothetical protein